CSWLLRTLAVLSLDLTRSSFSDAPTAEIYTLSLHDALPICRWQHAIVRDRHETHRQHADLAATHQLGAAAGGLQPREGCAGFLEDRKSTRLNSSHVKISYAVFCLKKKKRKRSISSRLV